MMTKADGVLPEIAWERLHLEERIDAYTVTYGTIGMDKDGNEYEGCWVECCDTIQITDIEKIVSHGKYC